MRKLFTALIVLAALYCLFWGVVALLFSYADKHKSFYENQLSKLFGQKVSIEHINTEWQGMHAAFELKGLAIEPGSQNSIEQKNTQASPLSFDWLAGKIDIVSVLKFWPQLKELSVQKPQLQIESLADNKLKIAGIIIDLNKRGSFSAQKLIKWFLNHKSAYLYDGSVIWQRAVGDYERYTDLSFVYQRNQQKRTANIVARINNDVLALSGQTTGDILTGQDWNAKVYVLESERMQSSLSGDVLINVVNGQGNAKLSNVNIHRVTNIITLLGLVELDSWIAKSHVRGHLHDVTFDFKGPLLSVTDWQLKAGVRDVSFKQTNIMPAMDNMNGDLVALPQHGTFKFSGKAIRLDWPRHFPKPINIEDAGGEFYWDRAADNILTLGLRNSHYRDAALQADNLIAQIELNASAGSQPLMIDASSDFKVLSLPKIENYFPSATHPEFRRWWLSAFSKGTAEEGQISYNGELSIDAINNGKAQLIGSAKFSDVDIDYGAQQDWPRALNAQGIISINNDVLDIMPQSVYLEKNKVKQLNLSINELFSKSRHLLIDGELDISFNEVMEFVLRGPLTKLKSANDEVDQQQKTKNTIPLYGPKGQANVSLSVNLPLSKLSDAKVKGVAKISQGQLKLPDDVFVNDINTSLSFTERSVASDWSKVDFLGGRANVKISTIKPTQPPQMKVELNGLADVSHVQTWLGQSITSLLKGKAAYKGNVVIIDDKLTIDVSSDLRGVSSSAPAPLSKTAKQARPFTLNLQTGGKKIQNKMQFNYANILSGKFQGELDSRNTLFDQSVLLVSDRKLNVSVLKPKSGVNIAVDNKYLDVDAWVQTIKTLTELDFKRASKSRALRPRRIPTPPIIQAMRSVNIKSKAALLAGKQFGSITLNAVSADGMHWAGRVLGDNIDGTVQAVPRGTPAKYKLNLSNLVWPAEKEDQNDSSYASNKSSLIRVLTKIDQLARPENFPELDVSVNKFVMGKRQLGRLKLQAKPAKTSWDISTLELQKDHIRLSATGQWLNDADQGSMTNVEFKSDFSHAGDVLGDLNFVDLMNKGRGNVNGKLQWQGAPHEFDIARLNGSFDVALKDGVLTQIKSGGGKLFGLLNANAVLRRLRLDFSDIFANGMAFDRLLYNGYFVDGNIIIRDGTIIGPAVYIDMQGNIGVLDKTVDLDINISPELGGNLTLLTALVNPAVGAAAFLTQKILKKRFLSPFLIKYRASGDWDDIKVESVNKKR